MSKSMVLGALLATLAMAGVARSQDSAQELKRLQGTWRLVALRTPKWKFQDATVLSMEVQVSGEEWAEIESGTAGIRSRITLGVVDSVKALDLTSQYVSEDIVENQVIRGIYKIEGDTLTVATARANDPRRPPQFIFAPPVNVLAVYKRVK